MRYLSIREAGELLGLHPATVRRRIGDGTIPAIRSGGKFGRWRISLDDIRELVVEFHRDARSQLGLYSDVAELEADREAAPGKGGE